MVTLVIAVVTLLTYVEAGAAVANANGVCDSPNEVVPGAETCANFGPNVIEFLGTGSTTCTVAAGSVPCTAYFYRYTGSATNQFNIAIPKVVQTKFTSGDALAAGCSQLITDGSGDPTTGFGKNQLTFNICRVAFNLASLPGAPPLANFSILADPSSPQSLSWQQKVSKDITADTLQGPAVAGAPVAETGAKLTAFNGATITYTIEGGQINVTSGSATVEPANQSLICNLNLVYSVPPVFPSDYTCLPVTYFSGTVDFRLGTNSTCTRYVNVGGFLQKISYTC